MVWDAVLELLSISSCLSHKRKTENQTDQSGRCFTATSLGTAYLIGQFGLSFYIPQQLEIGSTNRVYTSGGGGQGVVCHKCFAESNGYLSLT